MFRFHNIINFKCICLILILSLSLIIVISCGIEPNNLEIWIATQNYVKSNLKNPEIAKFPENYDNFISKIEEDKFLVNSYFIEEEKSCCKIMKTSFSCTIEYQNKKYIGNNLIFFGHENWEKTIIPLK